MSKGDTVASQGPEAIYSTRMERKSRDLREVKWDEYSSEDTQSLKVSTGFVVSETFEAIGRKTENGEQEDREKYRNKSAEKNLQEEFRQSRKELSTDMVLI